LFETLNISLFHQLYIFFRETMESLLNKHGFPRVPFPFHIDDDTLLNGLLSIFNLVIWNKRKTDLKKTFVLSHAKKYWSDFDHTNFEINMTDYSLITVRLKEDTALALFRVNRIHSTPSLEVICCGSVIITSVILISKFVWSKSLQYFLACDNTNVFFKSVFLLLNTK
jgi:hypothetical protein